MAPLRLVVACLALGGCSFAWDGFDPRLKGEGGSAGNASSSMAHGGAQMMVVDGGGGAGEDPCAACAEVCVGGVCLVTLQLVQNGDFSADLDSWTGENNAVNGEDTMVLWSTQGGVCENDSSTGPSARVLYQDLAIPTEIAQASFSIAFAQDNSDTLDPENVTVIEKDPYDANMDTPENAFRVDIIDPNDEVFYASIQLELFAPPDPMGDSSRLVPIDADVAGLADLLRTHAGGTLRLRIAQVESTFPWEVWFDDVSLEVVGKP